MQQDKIITEFLNNNHKDMWLLITENKIDNLLEMVQLQKSSQSIFTKLFNKKENQVETKELYTIVYELFKHEESKTLKKQEFKIMNSKSEELFKDLVRLLFAIELNGKYLKFEEIIGEKLYNSVQPIAEEIREKANGYPLNSINAQVWVGGANMRTGFSYLSYYYKKKGLIKSQLWVTKMRTFITLSIMGHYKNLVGPDMIEVAEIEETLGSFSEALEHYNAVIADFENELDYFKDSPEERPDQDEQGIFLSLLKSYQSVDRIEKTNNYQEKIQLIQQILN